MSETLSETLSDVRGYYEEYKFIYNIVPPSHNEIISGIAFARARYVPGSNLPVCMFFSVAVVIQRLPDKVHFFCTFLIISKMVWESGKTAEFACFAWRFPRKAESRENLKFAASGWRFPRKAEKSSFATVGMHALLIMARRFQNALINIQLKD